MIDFDRAAAGNQEEGAISATQIQAALRGTPPEKLREAYDAIVEAEVAAKELDSILTKTVGASRTVSFDALAATLKDLQKALAPHVGSASVAEQGAAPPPQGAAAAGQSSASGAGISGEIRSREDALRVLDQVSEFFRRTEPSSPVPLLLKRARRLVNLNFVELLNDLSPDSLAQIRTIAGLSEGENGTGAQ
jgi:type VI secretion system protein ImpA